MMKYATTKHLERAGRCGAEEVVSPHYKDTYGASRLPQMTAEHNPNENQVADENSFEEDPRHVSPPHFLKKHGVGEVVIGLIRKRGLDRFNTFSPNPMKAEHSAGLLCAGSVRNKGWGGFTGMKSAECRFFSNSQNRMTCSPHPSCVRGGVGKVHVLSSSTTVRHHALPLPTLSFMAGNVNSRLSVTLW